MQGNSESKRSFPLALKIMLFFSDEVKFWNVIKLFILTPFNHEVRKVLTTSETTRKALSENVFPVVRQSNQFWNNVL